jgi:hypothetical protein
MHQDIEKLLNAAKEKGSMTERQREIIISKAQQLGEDMTEVEFLLEEIPVKKAVIEQQTPSPTQEKPKSNKHGEVKKCPVCGALVQGFQACCPECGYMFEKVEANSSIERLMKMLNEARDKYKDVSPWAFKNSYNDELSIIKNFPIPNTKTDIIDFLLFLEPKAKDELDLYHEAYRQKYLECVKKAKLLFPEDKEITALLGSSENPTKPSILDSKAENSGCMAVMAFAIVTSLGLLGIIIF